MTWVIWQSHKEPVKSLRGTALREVEQGMVGRR